jgi:hypothetical protein
MSAYIVSREHIQYLVTAATSSVVLGRHGGPFHWFWRRQLQELKPHDDARAAEIGQMLWAENGKSINARYADDDEHKMVYGDHVPAICPMDQIQIIKAIHCYGYQSCEHDGWEESKAKAFVDAILDLVVYRLPGYDDAEWGPPKAMMLAKA